LGSLLLRDNGPFQKAEKRCNLISHLIKEFACSDGKFYACGLQPAARGPLAVRDAEVCNPQENFPLMNLMINKYPSYIPTHLKHCGM
jgi:hypothetical protein